MTVASETRKAGPFTGDGTVAQYPFAFKVFTSDQLLVTIADTDGNETQLDSSTDYTVALNPDQNADPGGSITLAAGPLAVGYLLVIEGNIDSLQLTSIPNLSGFYPKVIENAFDKLTMLYQQAGQRVFNALRLNATETAFVGGGKPIRNIAGPVSDDDAATAAYVRERIINAESIEAGQLRSDLAGGAAKVVIPKYSQVGGSARRGELRLREDGSGLWQSADDNNGTNPDAGGAGWSAIYDVAPFSSYGALRANNSPIAMAGYRIRVLGRGSLADGGQGEFRYDPADTTSADDGFVTIVDQRGQRFKRIPDPDGFFPAEAAGCVGDGNWETGAGTDNAAAYARIRAYGLANGGCGIRFASGKQYKSTADFRVFSGLSIQGDQNYSPILFGWYSSSGGVVLRSPTSGRNDPPLKQVSLVGFKIKRCGPKPEHGALLHNIDGLHIDFDCDAVPEAIGGGIAVSSIFPYNLPCRNVSISARVRFGANFAFQGGSIINGKLVNRGYEDCMREVIGIEPGALGYRYVTDANISANVINWPGHGMVKGDAIIYSRENNTAIPELASKPAYYFAVPVDNDNVRLCDTKVESLKASPTTLNITTPFSGTHMFLRCGQCINFDIGSATIITGDVPDKGSQTSVFDIVAASGGYFEGITNGNISVTERNPTSGNTSFGLWGVQDMVLSNCIAIGSKARGFRVGSTYVQALKFFGPDGVSTISITPVGNNLKLVPKGVIVSDCIAREFGIEGGTTDEGEVIWDNCDFRSSLPGANGLNLEAAAVLAGTRAVNCRADVPGTAFLGGSRGYGNRDLRAVNGPTSYYKSERWGESTHYVTAAGAAIPIATISNASRSSSSTRTYRGKIVVQVLAADAANTNSAYYTLMVHKLTGAATPQVVIVAGETVEIAGSGASIPKMTWSMVGDVLTASPIAPSSSVNPWFFFAKCDGELSFLPV